MIIRKPCYEQAEEKTSHSLRPEHWKNKYASVETNIPTRMKEGATNFVQFMRKPDKGVTQLEIT